MSAGQGLELALPTHQRHSRFRIDRRTAVAFALTRIRPRGWPSLASRRPDAGLGPGHVPARTTQPLYRLPEIPGATVLAALVRRRLRQPGHVGHQGEVMAEVFLRPFAEAGVLVALEGLGNFLPVVGREHL